MAELGKAKVITVHELENKLGSKKFLDFVAECEADFKAQIKQISNYVISNKQINMVFLSGPTSSGKTTFSTLFAESLTNAGRTTHLISMDDYYKLSKPIYDELGRPDYESIESLDMELLDHDLQKLQNMKEVHIPTFVFQSRTRIFEDHKIIKPRAGDTFMIEGLHGLSKKLVSSIDRDKSVGIFIMPHGKLLSDAGILDRKEMRMLRRLSRDAFHRGSSALSTIDFWPMIDSAEADFVPEYLERADFYVNSALEYEYCVIVPKAKEQIRLSLDQYMKGELPPSSNIKPGKFYADLNRAVKKAQKLLKACEQIPSVDPVVVPHDSILQEFI